MLSNHFVKLYMYTKLYKNTGMINPINIAVLYIFSSERWNWMTKKNIDLNYIASFVPSKLVRTEFRQRLDLEDPDFNFNFS